MQTAAEYNDPALYEDVQLRVIDLNLEGTQVVSSKEGTDSPLGCVDIFSGYDRRGGEDLAQEKFVCLLQW